MSHGKLDTNLDLILLDNGTWMILVVNIHQDVDFIFTMFTNN